MSTTPEGHEAQTPYAAILPAVTGLLDRVKGAAFRSTRKGGPRGAIRLRDGGAIVYKEETRHTRKGGGPGSFEQSGKFVRSVTLTDSTGKVETIRLVTRPNAPGASEVISVTHGEHTNSVVSDDTENAPQNINAVTQAVMKMAQLVAQAEPASGKGAVVERGRATTRGEIAGGLA